jgi:mRNA interferase RelE/StbE
VSGYRVYVTPSAVREIKGLPGNVRQRAKREIAGLQSDPRPPGSKALDLSDMEMPPGSELQVWRLRLEKWRVVYAISEAEKVVDVLALRKRPPYDYGDLGRLLGR